MSKGTCRRKPTHRIEESITGYYQKCSVDQKGLTLVQVKKFFEIYSEIDTDSILGDIYNVRDYLSLEEFRLLALACCKKNRLRPHCLSEIRLSVPKYRKFMDLFKSYTELSFTEETDNFLVLELWRKAFPDLPQPEIPSKQWEALGFQGVNPATDFRGSGKCGIHCLLSLVQHQRLFSRLKESAEQHNIPFATAAINVVMICYEFLGWGFKSPRVPSGRNPETYNRLCKLLFTAIPDEPESILEFIKQNFFKIFYLVFFSLMKVWEEIKGSYFDFPRILQLTEELIEKKLEQFLNVIQLDNYLHKKLFIEEKSLFSSSYLRVFFPDDSIQLVAVDETTSHLNQIMNKIILKSFEKGFTDCQAYDCLGKEIIFFDVELSSIYLQTIYFYPKDHPFVVVTDFESPEPVKQLSQKRPLKRETSRIKSRPSLLGISTPPLKRSSEIAVEKTGLRSTISTPDLRDSLANLSDAKEHKKFGRRETDTPKSRPMLRSIPSINNIVLKKSPPAFLKSTFSSPNLFGQVDEGKDKVGGLQVSQKENRSNVGKDGYSQQKYRRKKARGSQ